LPEETEGKNEEFPLWNVGVPASIWTWPHLNANQSRYGKAGFSLISAFNGIKGLNLIPYAVTFTNTVHRHYIRSKDWTLTYIIPFGINFYLSPSYRKSVMFLLLSLKCTLSKNVANKSNS
jgi:hypothetical protein